MYREYSTSCEVCVFLFVIILKLLENLVGWMTTSITLITASQKSITYSQNSEYTQNLLGKSHSLVRAVASKWLCHCVFDTVEIPMLHSVHCSLIFFHSNSLSCKCVTFFGAYTKSVPLPVKVSHYYCTVYTFLYLRPLKHVGFRLGASMSRARATENTDWVIYKLSRLWVGNRFLTQCSDKCYWSSHSSH